MQSTKLWQLLSSRSIQGQRESISQMLMLREIHSLLVLEKKRPEKNPGQSTYKRVRLWW